MTEIVLNRGEARPEDGKLALTIDGAPHFFEIATDKVSAQLLSEIPTRAHDLLDIAGTIFATDSALRRGGDTRPGFGAAWRHHLHFRIQVREPAFWGRPDIAAALKSAIESMTDDHVDFEFERAETLSQSPIFLDFDQSSAFAADQVIMFSGGLDSLAGVVETLSTTDARLALVTHRSAQKRMRHQDWLADTLRERFPGRILWVPIKARRCGGHAVETTQRSRSLLFAALGFLVSHVLGTRQLKFFENGVVSQQLPISPQVIGTMATRTTHPLVIRNLGHLLQLVAGEPFELVNPYNWLSKTDVVMRLRDHGSADLIAESVSCSEVHQRTVIKTHCGACSQCIDRRMALLASGMTEFDPPGIYETEVLTGAREKDDSRIMALDWTRHGHALADMDELKIFEKFGSEIGRIIDGFPNLPPQQAARQVLDLQRRHGQAVRTALRLGMQMHSEEFVAGQLPPTSLLGMFFTVMSGRPALPDTAAPSSHRAFPHQDECPAVPEAGSILPLRVQFSGEEKSSRLTVLGLGEVKGINATVVQPLKPKHDEDAASDQGSKDFRFTSVGEMASSLKTNKTVVEQRVLRCRRELAEFYREIEGAAPPKPLLIETRRQSGYRLDPDCRFVESGANASLKTGEAIALPAEPFVRKGANLSGSAALTNSKRLRAG